MLMKTAKGMRPLSALPGGVFKNRYQKQLEDNYPGVCMGMPPRPGSSSTAQAEDGTEIIDKRPDKVIIDRTLACPEAWLPPKRSLYKKANDSERGSRPIKVNRIALSKTSFVRKGHRREPEKERKTEATYKSSKSDFSTSAVSVSRQPSASAVSLQHQPSAVSLTPSPYTAHLPHIAHQGGSGFL